MLLTAALLFSVTLPALQTQTAPQRLVRVDLAASEATVRDLQDQGLDVIYIDAATGTAQVLVNDAGLAQIAGGSLRYETVTGDLTAFYAQRAEESSTLAAGAGLGSWLSPPFGQGDMGGFYTFAEVVSVLDQISATYPGIVTSKASIGQSIQGRELWMVKVSDNPGLDENEPEVRFDSLHHAREPEGMQTNLWYMLSLVEGYGNDPLATYLVDERETYFVLVVNPDGYVYNQQIAPNGGGLWRKNRRDNGDGTLGVDLNRNYPFEWGYDSAGSSTDTASEVYRGTGPASEPEVAAMVSFFSGRSFNTALSVHTFSNLWLSPWGYEELFPPSSAEFVEIGNLATEVNGYPHGPASIILYEANGVTIDYDLGAHGTFAWTPEIGNSDDGFWPAPDRIVPLAEENLLALQRTALAGGAYVRPTNVALAEVGDGDGFFDAGETVELTVTVRNSGLVTTATPVGLILSSTSPDVTILDGQHSFPALGSFAENTNGTLPLAFAIDAGAIPGTNVPYTLTITYEGYSQVLADSIAIGEPTPFLSDPAEFDLGWVTGLAADTAATGIWEQGDPIGTFSSGEDASPGADFTSGSGTQCFVTGNGGGGGGDDDVDDGLTTLISPPFDLSQVTNAQVEYARWYADLSNEDDVFQVSISNDDGATWHPLENVSQNDNEWRTVSFRVEDFVPQTDLMRLRWIAEDDPNNSVVEAAVDELHVTVYDAVPRMNVYGQPELGTRVDFNVTGEAGDPVDLYASRFAGEAQLPGVVGTLLLDPDLMFRIAQGQIPGSGLFQFQRVLPGDPVLAGFTFYFQAFVTSGGTTYLTNRDELTLE